MSSCLSQTGAARQGNDTFVVPSSSRPSEACSTSLFDLLSKCQETSGTHRAATITLKYTALDYGEVPFGKENETLGRSLFAQMWCLITTVVEVATNVVLFTWVPSISQRCFPVAVILKQHLWTILGAVQQKCLFSSVQEVGASGSLQDFLTEIHQDLNFKTNVLWMWKCRKTKKRALLHCLVGHSVAVDGRWAATMLMRAAPFLQDSQLSRVEHS